MPQEKAQTENLGRLPPRDLLNGFRALAVFDLPENGGNDDGVVDSGDAVWPKLLVWIDANHDGVSQPSELRPMRDDNVDRVIYDVFLVPAAESGTQDSGSQ